MCELSCSSRGVYRYYQRREPGVNILGYLANFKQYLEKQQSFKNYSKELQSGGGYSKTPHRAKMIFSFVRFSTLEVSRLL